MKQLHEKIRGKINRQKKTLQEEKKSTARREVERGDRDRLVSEKQKRSSRRDYQRLL